MGTLGNMANLDGDVKLVDDEALNAFKKKHADFLANEGLISDQDIQDLKEYFKNKAAEAIH